MTTIDVSDWKTLNVWRHPDGDACCRPGVRRLRELLADDGLDPVAGFSIKSSYTGTVYHYVVTDEGADGIHLHIYDDDLTEFQDFAWNATSIPVRAVGPCIVQGQMLITSPDLPTLFGMVGSGVIFADAVESDNPSTTALASVPRGICVAICNRAIICNDRSVFVSDPIAFDGGDIRTFVGQNVNQRPGPIYGAHEGAGGGLVVVTTEGTFALDADAFAVQVVGMSGTGWRLLSHLGAISYESSCVHRGRVYCLTKDGVSPCDVESNDEWRLSDQTMPRAFGGAISLLDYRRARMLVLEDGPVVVSDEAQAMWRSDLQTGRVSWWRSSYTDLGTMRGVLKPDSGVEWILADGAICSIGGDFDGDDSIESADGSEAVTATIHGVIEASASRNMLPRRVLHAAAVTGENHQISAAVRGSSHGADVPVDPFAIADGTEWGGGSFLTIPMVGAQIDFGDIHDTVATRDVGLELSSAGCLGRINTKPEITLSESAKGRPDAKG